MREPLEELVGSLLYEGYALYPYTPDATKNATPTPFGIVYPPAYAAECAGAFDHARLECVAQPAPGATLTATLRCLTPSGERPRGARASASSSARCAIGERVSAEFARRALHAALRAAGRRRSVLVRCVRAQHRRRRRRAGSRARRCAAR